MIVTSQPTPLDQWRQHLGRRHRRAQPRPLAAMGYLTDGPVIDGLVEIEKLTLVLLYDHLIRPDYCALRLAGYSGSRVPWGVCFGGRGNCRFAKDLMLQPVPGGEGYRLDLADEELLALGLQLERELHRHDRFSLQARQGPYLPKLWAGFHPDDADSITGDGPELAAYAANVGRTPASLLGRLRRKHAGLTSYPLAWVSHHWQQAAAVFADLRHFPKRQVFQLQQLGNLAGFHDAAEFDFVTRSGVKQRRSHTQGVPHALELDNSYAKAGRAGLRDRGRRNGSIHCQAG